eukprot:Colp12_sorted_trinity150504_noHs@13627
MWASASEIDIKWLHEHCPGLGPITSCTVTDISNTSSPRSCFRLLLQPGNITYVLKQLPSDEAGVPKPERIQLSLALGLAREGLFYEKLASSLGNIVPKVLYAKGDMKTGIKHTIMEDLSEYVDSGVLFGPGNPNNWQRDLATLTKRAGSPIPSASTVASVTFKAIAQVHARFWRDKTLLEQSWLRGAEWLSGAGEEQWQASQQYAKDRWLAAREKKTWDWDPLVFEAVDAAVAGLSWEEQKKRLNADTHWTLVQGDCWPGNVMWHHEGHVKLVDWEMVGLGSGPQELGQYVISNMEPTTRRECELHAVQEYYNQLIRSGVPSDFTFEQCWREYVIGGLERWLWFLCYYAGAEDELSIKSGAFFHAQIAAFMRDHNVTPGDITQLRP